MINATRRKLLQGLSVLPVLPVLAPWADSAHRNSAGRAAPMPQAGSSLNVIFHGLWAFICWDTCIQALAPCYPLHGYAAGGLSSNRVPLGRSGGYWLQGVTGVTAAKSFPFDDKWSAVFQKQGTIDFDFVYCSVLLPIPNRVRTPFCILKAATDPDFYEPGSGPRTAPAALAFAHVLIYDSYQGAAAISPIGSVQPDPGHAAPAFNLHFFASEEAPSVGMCPNNCKGDQHPFDLLNCVFPNLNARLNPRYLLTCGIYVPGQSPAGIEEGDVDHAMLRARSAKPGKLGEFSFTPVNCHPIVIDNTSLQA